MVNTAAIALYYALLYKVSSQLGSFNVSPSAMLRYNLISIITCICGQTVDF